MRGFLRVNENCITLGPTARSWNSRLIVGRVDYRVNCLNSQNEPRKVSWEIPLVWLTKKKKKNINPKSTGLTNTPTLLIHLINCGRYILYCPDWCNVVDPQFVDLNEGSPSIHNLFIWLMDGRRSTLCCPDWWTALAYFRDTTWNLNRLLSARTEKFIIPLLHFSMLLQCGLENIAKMLGHLVHHTLAQNKFWLLSSESRGEKTEVKLGGSFFTGVLSQWRSLLKKEF